MKRGISKKRKKNIKKALFAGAMLTAGAIALVKGKRRSSRLQATMKVRAAKHAARGSVKRMELATAFKTHRKDVRAGRASGLVTGKGGRQEMLSRWNVARKNSAAILRKMKKTHNPLQRRAARHTLRGKRVFGGAVHG